VRKLIYAGADASSVAGNSMEPSAHDREVESIVGRPSLRIALERGEESIADLLLESGARLPTTSIGNQNWNPLTSAIQGRNHRLFRSVLHCWAVS
jgi:hypothetical protein